MHKLLIEEEFAKIFKGLHIPKDIVEGIAQTLKESHQGKVTYHKNLYSDFNKEYQQYETRIERMYEDYLDGRITQDMYDRKQSTEIMWLPLYNVYRNFKKGLLINFSEFQKFFNKLVVIENQISRFVFNS